MAAVMIKPLVSMGETDRISAQKPLHQHSNPGMDLIYRVHPDNKATFRQLKICARQSVNLFSESIAAPDANRYFLKAA